MSLHKSEKTSQESCKSVCSIQKVWRAKKWRLCCFGTDVATWTSVLQEMSVTLM